ncbi:hypothetical protein RB597_004535 [Gaeumannomyces tritici]
MRPLTDTETQTLLAKLANYTGNSLKSLIAPLEDGDRYVFRLHKDRVYYVRLSIANLATSIAREKLMSLGTCLGKFTKSGKFRLHITALPILSEHARYKMWVRSNGEMPFLYGGNSKEFPSARPYLFSGPVDGGSANLSLNPPCSRQGARRPPDGRLPRAPGHRRLQHAGRPPRLRPDRQEHRRREAPRSHRHYMFPTVRLRRVPPGRGHSICHGLRGGCLLCSKSSSLGGKKDIQKIQV